MTERRAPLIAGVVGLVVIGLVVVLAISPAGGGDDERSGGVGTVAKPLIGETLDGTEVDIDQFRGKWVLVNFFATWCPPCVVEHPELVAFSERNAEAVQVISVAFDNTEITKVRDFFETHGGDWPVIVDGGSGASLDWGVIKLPESFLIDPAGDVSAKIKGGVTTLQLEELIAERTAGIAPATDATEGGS